MGGEPYGRSSVPRRMGGTATRIDGPGLTRTKIWTPGRQDSKRVRERTDKRQR